MKTTDKAIKGVGYAYTLLFYKERALLGFPDMALVDRIKSCAENENLSFSDAVKLMCIRYLLGERDNEATGDRDSPNTGQNNDESLAGVSADVGPQDQQV
jgi:hypothetical protein